MKQLSGLNRYVHGDSNALCDMCGFKFKSSKLRYNWKGQRVCQNDWEPRHPQDFVRGVKDDQRAPDPRPEPEDVFIQYVGDMGDIYSSVTTSTDMGRISSLTTGESDMGEM